MSKYDELCKSCDVALNNYYEHKFRVQDFLRHRFLPGLKRFIECPEDKIWTFDFKGSWDETPLPKAMISDADCYWNLGIAIRMEKKGFFDVGYLLRCREFEGKITVQIAGRSFTIIDDDDLEKCFSHVYEDIKYNNEEGLNDTLRGGTSRKIGFLSQIS